MCSGASFFTSSHISYFKIKTFPECAAKRWIDSNHTIANSVFNVPVILLFINGMKAANIASLCPMPLCGECYVIMCETHIHAVGL